MAFDANLQPRTGDDDLDANEQSIVSTTRSNSCAVIDLGEIRPEGMSCVVICPTAPTGTSPTLDLKLQESDAMASGYTDLVTFDQITAKGEYIRRFATAKRYVRHYATVGGTTPNFGKVEILIGDKEWKRL